MKRVKRPYPSRGAEALDAWLVAERRSQEWLAEQLRVHQTTVSIWLRTSRPKVQHAVAIAKLTGIPVEQWTEPSATKRAPRKAA